MTYEWEFETGGRPPGPLGRKCHRGPMIDVELRMSQPFVKTRDLVDCELLRKRLLDHIVDTTLVAVQTRECILRSLYSQIGPVFVKLTPRKKELWVLICEKRNSLLIDEDLKELDYMYRSALQWFPTFGVTRESIDMMLSALESNSPIVRVAARCGVVLMATFIEMG